VPEFRYVLPGLSAEGAQGGVSAFTPVYGGHAGSGRQQYKYDLTGRAGTEAIPAPTGNTQISPDMGDKAQAGTARSSDAPDVWFPQEWYQRVIAEPPGAGMPILRVDDTTTAQRTLLPVPAVNVALAARAAQAMSPPTGIVQRVRQLPWKPSLYEAPAG
jgi:hypothetical protein